MISVGFPMPKVAFLPIFILWFGVYDHVKNRDDCFRRDLSGHYGDDCGTSGCWARIYLVGAEHGRDAAASAMADRASGRAAPDHDRIAGGIADCAHRRDCNRDADGRNRSGRRHAGRFAHGRFARRVCRTDRDDCGRLLRHQADGLQGAGCCLGIRKPNGPPASCFLGKKTKIIRLLGS